MSTSIGGHGKMMIVAYRDRRFEFGPRLLVGRSPPCTVCWRLLEVFCRTRTITSRVQRSNLKHCQNWLYGRWTTLSLNPDLWGLGWFRSNCSRHAGKPPELHITLEPYVKSCPGMLGPLSVSARGRTHLDGASRSKPIPTLVWLHLRLTSYTTAGAPRTKATKAL